MRIFWKAVMVAWLGLGLSAMALPGGALTPLDSFANNNTNPANLFGQPGAAPTPGGGQLGEWTVSFGGQIGISGAGFASLSGGTGESGLADMNTDMNIMAAGGVGSENLPAGSANFSGGTAGDLAAAVNALSATDFSDDTVYTGTAIYQEFSTAGALGDYVSWTTTTNPGGNPPPNNAIQYVYFLNLDTGADFAITTATGAQNNPVKLANNTRYIVGFGVLSNTALDSFGLLNIQQVPELDPASGALPLSLALLGFLFVSERKRRIQLT